MKSVSDIANEIVAREGGFANDPADPGGATNHGVTLATLRRLGIDLDGDGATGLSDVQALSAGQAAQIFVEQYFRRPGLGGLPDCLQASVFDMYVNAGANAVKILQRLLRDLGHEVAADGALGPRTLAAAQDAARPDPALLADAYGIARRNYYYVLADARPQSRRFARRRDGGKGGWILRAEEFISPRFRLSDAEHRERTAKWA
ncbi:MAG: peptidoglycan-binding protein [Proteobacteria bacterium]|nr:peptidoglycan-binding protein [Pseudomonadota bacterium]MBS0574102.1 peptidoglycan-binding protein [Pseudomonadota bacterium]